MKVELVEFRRCCCCIPLRYGLLVLGYLKLIVSALLLVFLVTQSVFFLIFIASKPSATFGMQLVFLGLLIIIFLGETVFSIIFVVGGHKKSPKILRIYNNFSIGILILFSLMLLLYMGVMMHYYIPRYGFLDTTAILRSIVIIGFANICFQVYMILMTKSEITKLENNCNFEFSNIGVEAECTMVEGGVGNHETNTQMSVPAELSEGNEMEENAQETKKNGNYVQLY